MDTRRWSDIIPPHGALTFAAMWDPEEGIITFSGGKLLDSDVCDGEMHHTHAPRDIQDGQSQVLTVDRLTLPLPSSILVGPDGELRRAGAPTVTFATSALDDAQSEVDPYLQYYRTYMPPRLGDATMHSAFDGAGRKAGQRRHVQVQLGTLGRQLYSVVAYPFGGRGERKSESEDSGYATVTDEGFFEEVPWTARSNTSAPMLVNLNLKSAFSISTTSTTGYVDVDLPSATPSGHPVPDSPSVYSYSTPPESEQWSTLHSLGHGTCPNERHARRLVKKSRPLRLPPPLQLQLPADPAEVLARAAYNHSFAQADSPTAASRHGLKRQKSMVDVVKKAVGRLAKCSYRNVREGEDERWVVVNISHRITQYVCTLED